MVELTGHPNRAEVVRRTKIDGEAELRAEWQWRTAAGMPDSVGERRNRTRGLMEKVEGEVTRLGVRGNRAEQREMAGAVAGDGLCSAWLVPSLGKERNEWNWIRTSRRAAKLRGDGVRRDG